MRKNDLTQVILKNMLEYDFNTGMFFWLVARGQNKVGDRAGYEHPSGYRFIKLFGHLYAEGRLAFLWMTGARPKIQVDHGNTIRNDNRWSN